MYVSLVLNCNMEEMMKIEERVMNTFLTYVHVYKWLKRVSEMSNCTYSMHRTAQGQRQIEREREGWVPGVEWKE
jgi:hypothetical protein